MKHNHVLKTAAVKRFDVKNFQTRYENHDVRNFVARKILKITKVINYLIENSDAYKRQTQIGTLNHATHLTDAQNLFARLVRA